jgi:alpha-1,3-rhamnosyl/mannosyltransferase
MTLRVGLSATTLEPSVFGGRLDGIGVYTKALMSEILALGYDVVPMSYVPKDRASVGRSLAPSYPVAIARSLFLPSTFRPRPSVDVFHATDYRIAAMACPVVATLHDAIPHVFPEYSNPRFRTLKNALMKRMARYSDLVIAISEFSVPELVEHYDVDPERIRVVPNGIDGIWCESLPPDQIDKVLMHHDLPRGYFLSVGTLQPRKNFERIIKAHRALPSDLRAEHPLVIVGKPGWGCDSLLAVLSQEEANGSIRWLSGVRGLSELRALYQGAGIFVFPSLYEGFGLPVLEAFASGIPVITSNSTSLPEVSKGIGVEVDPMRTDDIANAMLELAMTPDQHHWRISAGLKRAREMSWRATAEKTVSVYGELV